VEGTERDCMLYTVFFLLERDVLWVFNISLCNKTRDIVQSLQYFYFKK
jgi:hypothetical protein